MNQKSRVGAPAPEQPVPSARQRAPACPDPCTLCQGVTEQGQLRHRPGCTLMPEGRRGASCGALADQSEQLAHVQHCKVKLLCDDKHPHTWRCMLDPLCPLYQGVSAPLTNQFPFVVNRKWFITNPLQFTNNRFSSSNNSFPFTINSLSFIDNRIAKKSTVRCEFPLGNPHFCRQTTEPWDSVRYFTYPF